MAVEKAAKKKKGKKREAKAGAFVTAVRKIPADGHVSFGEWAWIWFRPPSYHVIVIHNDNISPATWETHASRGFLQTSADWVCWANKDPKSHTIFFVGGAAPLDALIPVTKIVIPANTPSAWYRISRASGSFGQTVRYNYYVDVPPGPDGPSVISED
jgi:hypothetical protein